MRRSIRATGRARNHERAAQLSSKSSTSRGENTLPNAKASSQNGLPRLSPVNVMSAAASSKAVGMAFLGRQKESRKASNIPASAQTSSTSAVHLMAGTNG